jgi:membrane protein
MGFRLPRVRRLGRAILHEARSENITFLAGSLAYHAFISLLPLLVLLLVAISTLGSESLESGFLAVVRALLSPGGRDVAVTDLFVSELRTASQSASVSLIGVVVLFWGTMRIFRGIDTAFSEVYETEAANSFGDQLLDGAIVFVAFGGAVVAAGMLERAIPDESAFSKLVLVASLAVTLYPMYFVFPDTDVSVLEVVPGTLFAAVGLTLLEGLFRFYVAASASGDEPTIITGVLVLLTWLYFASLLVLLGVVVNAVLANRSDDVSVRPVLGGNAPQVGGDADSVDRRRIVDSLNRLDQALSGNAVVEISVGDETVSLPAPRSYQTDTRAAGFEFGSGRVGLTLRWAGTATPDTESSTQGQNQADSDGSADAED